MTRFMVEQRSKFSAKDVLARVHQRQVRLFGFELTLRDCSPRLRFRSGVYDAIEANVTTARFGFVSQRSFHIAFAFHNDKDTLYYDVSTMAGPETYDVRDISKVAYELNNSDSAQQIIDKTPDYLKRYIADQLLLCVRMDMSGFPHGYLMGAWTNVMCDAAGLIYVEEKPENSMQLIDLFDVAEHNGQQVYRPSAAKVKIAEVILNLPTREDNDG